MAKKQVQPKPVAKKVTPARLRQVSDSVSKASSGNFLVAHKLIGEAKAKPSLAKPYGEKAKQMLKTAAKQDSAVKKYDRILGAHAAKKKK